MEHEEFEPVPSLSKEDIEVVKSLTDTDIKKIDSWLLSCAEAKWKKVATIVARAIELSDAAGELLEVPDLFFGMRIEHLVQIGKLESRGDLTRMRYSEVRRIE